MSAEDDVLDVQTIRIEPNDCPLEEPLSLHFEFKARKDIENAMWRINYLVDYTNKRRIAELGTVTPEGGRYAAGDTLHTFDFSIASVDLSSFKKRDVLNVGLLAAVLESGGEEIYQVGMVTQVSETDGKMARLIMSPIE
eukprot:TRINITY_DN1697_c1_g1_i2.p1 TRINITY_DN1697_c1_g1~~TRINITY_DN1697_c1_g1_i2.p1  ORF type:complete len:139 (+),score=71.79 TRINITY_DN1697_c1_g1_i2:71-487(+)